jgi:hypothetical protein
MRFFSLLVLAALSLSFAADSAIASDANSKSAGQPVRKSKLPEPALSAPTPRPAPRPSPEPYSPPARPSPSPAPAPAPAPKVTSSSVDEPFITEKDVDEFLNSRGVKKAAARVFLTLLCIGSVIGVTFLSSIVTWLSRKHEAEK